jgi:L-ribulose-5-phosphate 4-epimerase
MPADEKGYIQFVCDWQRSDAPNDPQAEEVIRWRNRLARLGLIGVYPDGISFGNVSVRMNPQGFLITGTATGAIPEIGPEHLCHVTSADILANRVCCRGPVPASSESLSHAAVYEILTEAAAVIHVHHLGIWQAYCGKLPTTDSQAEAGTPAMGHAITRLLKGHGSIPGGVFMMGGHREGWMAFGRDADEAGNRVLRLWDAWCLRRQQNPATG